MSAIALQKAYLFALASGRSTNEAALKGHCHRSDGLNAAAANKATLTALTIIKVSRLQHFDVVCMLCSMLTTGSLSRD
jgi:hypothetical protein